MRELGAFSHLKGIESLLTTSERKTILKLFFLLQVTTIHPPFANLSYGGEMRVRGIAVAAEMVYISPLDTLLAKGIFTESLNQAVVVVEDI